MDKKLLTITELAEAMGVTRITIQNWKKKGMPYLRFPDDKKLRFRVRYDVAEVRRWINEQQKAMQKGDR